MISLQANLPVLQVGNQLVPSYEAGWLEQSIACAAHKAGHEKWTMAELVASGVFVYLRDRFLGTRITLVDLFDKIARTLDTVGFPDIAAMLEPAAPPISISLAQLAREATPGFDLLFYQLVEAQIAEARESGASTIRLTDFLASVRLLEGTRKWKHAAEGRRAELKTLMAHRAATGMFSFDIR